jgi:cell division septation protein DedD
MENAAEANEISIQKKGQIEQIKEGQVKLYDTDAEKPDEEASGSNPESDPKSDIDEELKDETSNKAPEKIQTDEIQTDTVEHDPPLQEINTATTDIQDATNTNEVKKTSMDDTSYTSLEPLPIQSKTIRPIEDTNTPAINRQSKPSATPVILSTEAVQVETIPTLALASIAPIPLVETNIEPEQHKKRNQTSNSNEATTEKKAYRFAIQIASVRDPAIADQLTEELIAKGLSAYQIVAELPSSGLWYRIRVGHYLNRQIALNKLNEIKRDLNQAILVRY